VLLVLGAAGVGLVLTPALRTLVDHHAIDIVLFVLVLAAAMTLPERALADLPNRAGRLAAVEALAVVGVPVIAWTAAHLVPAGPARLGITSIGVAPAEIATVALTTVALGETATAAALLVASTAVTAVLAAPVLSLLAGGAGVRAGDLVATLVVVVLVPFALGLVARGAVAADVGEPAGKVASGAVIVLVALVGSQVQLDHTLVRAALALLVVVGASALLGMALGRLAGPADRSAVLLSVSMRDFAVAAGIASAAFGAKAAAPLGLYGILVMVWGSLVAARSRRRPAADQVEGNRTA
jgi:predicted Na+-dependent transporter